MSLYPRAQRGREGGRAGGLDRRRGCLVTCPFESGAGGTMLPLTLLTGTFGSSESLM